MQVLPVVVHVLKLCCPQLATCQDTDKPGGIGVVVERGWSNGGQSGRAQMFKLGEVKSTNSIPLAQPIVRLRTH